jgi:hypothetical protein
VASGDDPESGSGFSKDSSGSVFADPATASSDAGNFPDGWTWKQIEASILGGAAIAPGSGGEARAGLVSNSATLTRAAQVFHVTQQRLAMVAESIEKQAAALAGENGPWQGVAAEKFLASMNRFAMEIRRRVTQLSGGGTGNNNVAVELFNDGQYLRWAQEQIIAIDNWYATQARLFGHTMANGQAHIADLPKFVDAMTKDMATVARTVSSKYVSTVNGLQKPDADVPPPTSGDLNLPPPPNSGGSGGDGSVPPPDLAPPPDGTGGPDSAAPNNLSAIPPPPGTGGAGDAGLNSGAGDIGDVAPVPFPDGASPPGFGGGGGTGGAGDGLPNGRIGDIAPVPFSDGASPPGFGGGGGTGGAGDGFPNGGPGDVAPVPFPGAVGPGSVGGGGTAGGGGTGSGSGPFEEFPLGDPPGADEGLGNLGIGDGSSGGSGTGLGGSDGLGSGIPSPAEFPGDLSGPGLPDTGGLPDFGGLPDTGGTVGDGAATPVPFPDSFAPLADGTHGGGLVPGTTGSSSPFGAGGVTDFAEVGSPNSAGVTGPGGLQAPGAGFPGMPMGGMPMGGAGGAAGAGGSEASDASGLLGVGTQPWESPPLLDGFGEPIGSAGAAPGESAPWAPPAVDLAGPEPAASGFPTGAGVPADAASTADGFVASTADPATGVPGAVGAGMPMAGMPMAGMPAASGAGAAGAGSGEASDASGLLDAGSQAWDGTPSADGVGDPDGAAGSAPMTAASWAAAAVPAAPDSTGTSERADDAGRAGDGHPVDPSRDSAWSDNDDPSGVAAPDSGAAAWAPAAEPAEASSGAGSGSFLVPDPSTPDVGFVVPGGVLPVPLPVATPTAGGTGAGATGSAGAPARAATATGWQALHGEDRDAVDEPATGAAGGPAAGPDGDARGVDRSRRSGPQERPAIPIEALERAVAPAGWATSGVPEVVAVGASADGRSGGATELRPPGGGGDRQHAAGADDERGVPAVSAMLQPVTASGPAEHRVPVVSASPVHEDTSAWDVDSIGLFPLLGSGGAAAGAAVPSTGATTVWAMASPGPATDRPVREPERGTLQGGPELPPPIDFEAYGPLCGGADPSPDPDPEFVDDDLDDDLDDDDDVPRTMADLLTLDDSAWGGDNDSSGVLE